MKNYLIIGASSGIGYELAQLLVKNGHKVYGTYCKKELISNQLGLEYHHLDVMEEDLNFDYLPEQIDGLVYCPGTINLKPFHRLKPASFTNDFNLQVVGAVKVVQAIMPKMKTVENASIIFFSTVAAQMGFNFHTQVAASKGAVEGFTRALAAELAPTIRVNAIAPSLTNTPLAEKLLSSEDKIKANDERHPLKRIGTPADLAEMAVFLLSDKSTWISGQIFHVDGGMSTLKI